MMEATKTINTETKGKIFDNNAAKGLVERIIVQPKDLVKEKNIQNNTQSLNPWDELFFLQEKIYREYGFDVGVYEYERLRSVIEARTRTLKMDLKQYYKMFDKNEFKELLGELGVNESEFFRDAKVFEEFSKILSFLLEEKRRIGHSLRIWSAGCAAGEEPYSIAMMLKESKTDIPYSIIATDMDEDALKKAKEAAYRERSLMGMKEEYMKYFEKRKEKYFLSDEIKDMVTFLHSDITKSSMPSFFDVIFCRNVLMYFNQRTRDRMFEIFYGNLKDNGFLIVGKGELVFYTSCRKFFYPYVFEENIYKKERRKIKKEHFPERRKMTGWEVSP